MDDLRSMTASEVVKGLGRAYLSRQKPNGQYRECRFPCQRPGAARECAVSVDPGHNGKVWAVSGPPEAPTLAPSINCECGWHGFIIEGEVRK